MSKLLCLTSSLWHLPLPPSSTPPHSSFSFTHPPNNPTSPSSHKATPTTGQCFLLLHLFLSIHSSTPTPSPPLESRTKMHDRFLLEANCLPAGVHSFYSQHAQGLNTSRTALCQTRSSHSSVCTHPLRELLQLRLATSSPTR